jgi:hypothetical protein
MIPDASHWWSSEPLGPSERYPFQARKWVFRFGDHCRVWRTEDVTPIRSCGKGL